MADDTVQVKIGGDLSGLKTAFKDAATEVKNGASSMTDSLKSVKEGVEALAVVEAFDKLKEGFSEVVAATTGAADATRRLSVALGATPEAASTLKSELASIGASADTYIGALDHLARQMKQNEDGLNALGIATRNADGTTRDSQAVMLDALKVVGQYKPGLDQAQVSMLLFGRSVEAVRELMPLLSRSAEEAAARTEALGLKATDASQAMEGQFKLAVNDAKESTEGVFNAIGQQLLPVLTDMIKRFNDAAPAIIQDAKILGEDLAKGIQYAAAAFHFLVASVQAATVEVAAAAKIIWDALHGDWSAVKADWQAGLSSLADISKRYSEQIKADFAEVKAATVDPFAVPKGKKTYTPTDKGGASDKDVVLKAQLEGELAIVKEYDNEQTAELKRSYDAGLVSTKEYYAQRLALAQQSIDIEISVNQRLQQSVAAQKTAAAGAKDDKGVQAALAEQIKLEDQLVVLESKRAAITKASAEEMQAAEEKEATAAALAHQASQEKIQIDALDSQQKIIEAAARAGKIQEDDAIAAFRRIEKEKYDIEAQGIKDRAALEGDAAAQSQATQDALAEKFAEYQKKDTEISVEQIKQRKDLETQALQDIQNDFATALDQIVGQHKKAFAAITDLLNSLQNQFQQMASKEIASTLFGGAGPGGAGGAGAGGGGLLASLFSSLFGGGSGGLAPGQAGPPAPGGGLLAAIASILPAFAAGTDFVPSTGLALLHAGEAVVPAADNRNRDGGRSNQQRVTQNFHVPAGPTYQTQNQIAAAAARGLRRAGRNT